MTVMARTGTGLPAVLDRYARPMATVLVVDDDPVVRDVVARYLERDGLRPLQAADGAAARRLVEETDPDLVVLDVMLPGVNGLDLCRWIRSRARPPSSC